VDPTHRRRAQIGLAAAAQYGFAPAGGYAVQEHGLIERPSEDVDLFTGWDRRGDFADAVQAVVAAYEESGYQVGVIQQFDTFARLSVHHLDQPDLPFKVELAATCALGAEAWSTRSLIMVAPRLDIRVRTQAAPERVGVSVRG
jgi:hypothetical protein